MGLLDDAIREHLELKRRLGADEGEIKELEDEAFGPPTRPGEPDFPSAEEQASASQATAEPVAPEEAEVRAPAPEPAGHEALQGLMGEEPQRLSELPAAEEAEPPGEAPVEAELPPPEPKAPSTFTTEEREAIAGQPTEIHEPPSEEGLELGELELELDDELEEVGELASEPLPAEDELADEPFTGEEELADEAFLDDEELADQPPSADEDSTESQPAQPADEDVLEETPEFLRDNPDDDELWFEQGEPKDFDL